MASLADILASRGQPGMSYNPDNPTPAQMRRMGPIQNRWENQQDVASGNQLQSALGQQQVLTPQQQMQLRQLIMQRALSQRLGGQ